MKYLLRIVSVVAFLAIMSCQKETIALDNTNVDLTQNVATLAKDQTPNSMYNNSIFGIYHGIIVSLNTQKRGKIWINLNNNGTYTAQAEMLNGSTILYVLNNNLSVESDVHEYHFEATGSIKSAFIMNITETEVLFTNVKVQNEAFHINVLKNTSKRMNLAFIGKFGEGTPPTDATGCVEPDFRGTWSLLADGTNPEPNGPDTAEGITKLVVTFGGSVFEDTDFEITDYPCEGADLWVPQMVRKVFPASPEDFISEEVFAPDQVSDINGTTNWYLFQAGGIGYFDETCDNSIQHGVFTWTNTAGTISRNGYITMDFLIDPCYPE